MWKDYSRDYIKNNRAVGYSIMAASFIAALFLSFLCSLFYNFWLDSAGNGEKEVPVVLAGFYLIVVFLVCLSLILVIHNSFAVSMRSRLHQFGIFSSIGATPGQIRVCLLQEAFMVSFFPILAGILAGTLCSFGTVWAMGAFAENLAGGRRMDFAMHPAILVMILVLSLLTVLLSAWIPARKLSRITPLEAIRGTGELQLEKKKSSFQLSALFGVEGELAGNALRAQRKALRTTTVSMIFAFLGFMLMQSFFTISGISTEHTYFEAYQDAWDVYVTVKDTKIEDFALTGEVRETEGAQSAVIYQKAQMKSLVPADCISPELQEKGGLEALTGVSPADESMSGSFGGLQPEDGACLTETTLVILDDESFAEYCRQIGTRVQTDGVIVYNRIWNSADSNFRYPKYLPYIKEDTEQITLCGMDSPVGIPVLACSGEVPVLREEYPDYALVQFMPLSLWREFGARLGGAEGDLRIRLLSEDRKNPAALHALETDILQVLGKRYETESENRIQEKRDNDTMIWGYKMILGGLCALFALIGIASMFANTLGFLSQRRREFARLLSVGLTSGGIWKIFCLEAVGLIGRPLFLAALLSGAATAFMIKISYLDPAEFIRQAPVGPILVFILVVFGFAALAYYLGGKKLLQMDLAQALRDDTFL